MKATEIRDIVFHLEKELYILSQEIAQEIDFDGIDIVYLRSKFKGITNVANHIEGQLKHRK